MSAIVRALTLVAVPLLLAGTAQSTEAQILRKIKKKAKSATEQRVENAAEKAIDQGLDNLEGVVICLVTDVECIDEAKSAGKAVQLIDEEGNPVEPDEGAVGEGIWLNYDFVPGERVLFVEDFREDRAGDFPRRLEFKTGNMEVAEVGGRPALRAGTISEFVIPLPETLPERFTLEIEYAILKGVNVSHPLEIHFSDDRNAPHVYIHPRSAGLLGSGLDSRSESPQQSDRFFPVRVMADGPHVKVYLGETRVANVPNAELGRSDRIRVRMTASRDWPKLIGSIRIAAGGRDLYDALQQDGRVATQGILFDTGSDALRPESTPTLKEIGEMLRDHPDLRLVIEGHTDSVGEDDANRALSERRANAVRDFLLEKYTIAPDRLSAEGLGESRPVADNATAEGRQQNRRVELVRQ